MLNAWCPVGSPWWCLLPSDGQWWLLLPDGTWLPVPSTAWCPLPSKNAWCPVVSAAHCWLPLPGARQYPPVLAAWCLLVPGAQWHTWWVMPTGGYQCLVPAGSWGLPLPSTQSPPDALAHGCPKIFFKFHSHNDVSSGSFKYFLMFDSYLQISASNGFGSQSWLKSGTQR